MRTTAVVFGRQDYKRRDTVRIFWPPAELGGLNWSTTYRHIGSVAAILTHMISLSLSLRCVRFSIFNDLSCRPPFRDVYFRHFSYPLALGGEHAEYTQGYNLFRPPPLPLAHYYLFTYTACRAVLASFAHVVGVFFVFIPVLCKKKTERTVFFPPIFSFF